MSPARRRAAALRVVVGVALVAASGVVVLGTGAAALLDANWGGWTGVLITAGLLAVAGGAVAVRLTHLELMTARRRAAEERTAQARAYLAVAERREADHQRHATALQARIAERQLTIGQLQDLLVATQRRLAEQRRRADSATDRMADAVRRADESDLRAAEAIVTVAELEQEVADLRAAVLAWEAAHPGARPELRSVV